jgi:hypothetical protein
VTAATSFEVLAMIHQSSDAISTASHAAVIVGAGVGTLVGAGVGALVGGGVGKREILGLGVGGSVGIGVGTGVTVGETVGAVVPTKIAMSSTAMSLRKSGPVVPTKRTRETSVSITTVARNHPSP